MENEKYLTEQIITYIGNKRSLLSFIGNSVELVKQELGKDKLDTFDVFSGSGIVSRFLKQYSDNLYTNDFEDYANTINRCYLTNKSDIDEKELTKWFNYVNEQAITLQSGFITEMYAPKDDNNIKDGERVFYTNRNAKYIDTVRQILESVPEPYKTLLLGPLLYEASVKTNTSGVFKGFYKNSTTKKGQFGGNGKNALGRILADIKLQLPVLSDNNCNVHVLQGDSNIVCKDVPQVDLAYLDPPYNQHPYSSNYFMLNLINNYKKPEEISKVSGIPTDWNKSDYNKKAKALNSLSDLVNNLKAKYVLISFSSDGFISYDEMVNMLNQYGDVRTFDKEYNTFRASRNLHDRDIHVTEYLFLLHKDGD